MRKSGYVFYFRREIYTYCSQDVSILRLCCVKFRDLFVAETGVDPFQYCTISGAVLMIYKTNYLPKDTIGIVSKNLYGNAYKPY